MKQLTGEQRTYLLVADVTEESAAAARWLGDLCRADAAVRVAVLDVFVPRGEYGERLASGEWSEPVDVAMEHHARDAFANVLAALGMDRSRVSTLSRLGRAAEEILATAREGGADAIVLGQEPTSPWRHVFRSTLAERLEREAPCPVVTVAAAAALAA